MCYFFEGKKKTYFVILIGRFISNLCKRFSLQFSPPYFFLNNWNIVIQNVIVSFNLTKHGKLNLPYGTRIWKTEHSKNSLLRILDSRYLNNYFHWLKEY